MYWGVEFSGRSGTFASEVKSAIRLLYRFYRPGEENDAHCSPHSREELKDQLQNSCQVIDKSMSFNRVYSRNISFGGLLSEMWSILFSGDRCCLAT